MIDVVHQYKLYILSLAGDILGAFTPEPDRGFGIRHVTWHPSGAYIAVSGYDDKVRDSDNYAEAEIDLPTRFIYSRT